MGPERPVGSEMRSGLIAGEGAASRPIRRLGAGEANLKRDDAVVEALTVTEALRDTAPESGVRIIGARIIGARTRDCNRSPPV